MNGRRLPLLALAVSAVLALAIAAGACRMIKNKLGISETVENPADGTPEKVIQDVLKSALEKDFDTGWRQFAKLLHSDQRSAASLQQWKGINYPAFRKKVELYVKDPSLVSYAIERVDEEPDGGQTFFITNAKSDMPTPLTLIQDKEADGAWRVKRCSL